MTNLVKSLIRVGCYTQFLLLLFKDNFFLRVVRSASVFFLITSLTSAIKNKNSLARSKNPRCCYCKMHSNWSKSTPMNSNPDWRQNKNKKETLSYFMSAFSVLEKWQKVMQEHYKSCCTLSIKTQNSAEFCVWPQQQRCEFCNEAFANIFHLT